MATHHIPGSVMMAVKDGAIIFAKGYGVADLKSGRPMDPADTLLRVGSISKLVTATAVLQLAGEDRVDLNRDVRSYVDPEILNSYEGAVSLQRLLTHTAGVGDKFVGQTARRGEALLDLEQHLRDQFPPPLPLPGMIINYSNFGITLAAHTVEKVTGHTFENYAQEFIFKPVGMHDTTFIADRESLSRVAVGYNYIFGGYRELAFRHWLAYPAASLVSTGMDIARFMIAHLEAGNNSAPEQQTSPLLPRKIARQAYRRQFTLHPHAPGIAYVFWERIENGQTMLWHSGHMPGQRSGLFLFPDHGFGLFINSNTEVRLFDLFIRDFMDHFFPDSESEYPAPQANVARSRPEDTARYAGHYRQTWYPRRTLGKIAAFHGLQGQEIIVKPIAGENRIIVDGRVHEPVAPALFRERNGDGLTAFWETPSGKVLFAYQGGMDSYHRLAWYHTKNFHHTFVGIIFAIYSVSLIVFSRRVIASRPKQLGNRLKPPLPLQAARMCVLAMSGLFLVFIAGMIGLAAMGAYDMTEEIRTPLLTLLALPPAAIGFGCAALVLLLIAWGAPGRSRYETIQYIVVLAATAIAVWFLDYWHLLGYRF